ncbi:MAG: insulinase family protein [bacterium]
MKENERIDSFRVTRVRDIPELGGPLYELIHEKTGAELLWLARPDENKSFGIAFKTVPEDSTGVFHILEHSVLCGSEKYPLKDPFVALLKSSVNTFLNAMTYPDKTVYPFSSRNDKDFLNLMDIYLDAVLHPNIYRNPAIFRQEGWRYEFDESGKAQRQGVVLNEMKGAYAEMDTVLENALNRVLFPDSPYRHESGGTPDNIPDLTYEQFLEMHRTFYHPSNARIVLVGSVDIASCLQKIASFLDPYERLERDFTIPFQRTIFPVELEVPYEIGQEEDAAGKTVYAQGYLIGAFDEKEKLYAASILADYLAGDNEAPLKKEILSRDLGQDFDLFLRDGILEPWMGWVVRNTSPEKLPEIREAVEGLLRRLCEEGLDPDRLEASYNRFAFRARDKDSGFARSLGEALITLDSWLYGGDPALFLTVEETLDALAGKLNTGYFESLLRTLLVENPNHAAVRLTPSRTLGAEKSAAERQRVEKVQAGWSEAETEAKKQELEAVRRWQQTPDTPEELAAIPVLSLSDIDPTPEDISPRVTGKDGVTVLTHENGSALVTMNLHFNADDLTAEELPLASLLCTLNGMLRTRRHSAAELSLLLKKYTGRYNLYTNPYVRLDRSRRCNVVLNLVALKRCEQEAAELAAELLTEVDYTDLAAMKAVMAQTVMALRDAATGAGHKLGILRAGASLTEWGVCKELLSGGSSLKWLTKVSEAPDEALAARLEALAKKLFVKNRLTVSLSASADPALWERVAEKLPAGSPAGAPAKLALFPAERVGITIPAQVGFAIRGAHTENPFSGSAYVLQNILNFSYLWGEIRVTGGAYGCGYSPSDSGDLFYFSYRDPKPGRSLGVYEGSEGFLRDYLAEKPDLTSSILAAWSAADPLLNAQSRIALADTRWFRGITMEDVKRLRREILTTDADALLALLPDLSLASRSPVCVVVAGKELLETCEGLDRVETV